MKKLLTALILSLFIIVLTGAGCTQQQEVEQVGGAESTIAIRGFAFNPPELTVKAGTRITWANQDSVLHDVTIDNGLFDRDLNPGESFSYTFNEPGIYDYYCDIHPSMKGRLIVE